MNKYKVTFVYHRKTLKGNPKKSKTHTFFSEAESEKVVRWNCRMMKTNPDEIIIEQVE
jgi:hypothetical protein